MLYNPLQKGMSIIEVIIVAAIVTIFFSGLFASFYYTISLIQDSKARQTALSVATNQMEFIRSLAYDAVGTVAGIPSGNIPQVSTSTLNGIDFTIRTLIEYVDDPADGLGAADVNGITTDYKTAKITVSWESRGVPKELFVVSRVIPRSIETNVGGGTLRVNVFDANVLPLPGATVRLTNTTGTTTIDVTRTTNVDGVALFGGAPAGAGYEITVSRAGYSTDSTQAITTELVSPASPPASVAEADITTLNFFIDELSTLNIKTVSDRTYNIFIETFASSTALATSSNTEVDGGGLLLEEVAGSYSANGFAELLPVTPASLVGWGAITVVDTIPALTARTFQLFTNEATPTLIPNSVLPGNSSGFTTNSLDISGLNPVTYPSFIVRFNLETADSDATPFVDELSVSYVEADTILPSVSFDMIGSKSLGNNASGSPVVKFATTSSTNALGETTFSNLEWDSYQFSPGGYSIVEACPAHPINLTPGSNQNVTFTLATFSTHALRVVVTDMAGIPQSDVDLRLERSGYDVTRTTSLCGQASFLGLSEENDYILTASVGGTPVWSGTDVGVSGQQVSVIQLP